jgi:hypothetical protein
MLAAYQDARCPEKAEGCSPHARGPTGGAEDPQAAPRPRQYRKACSTPAS